MNILSGILLLLVTIQANAQYPFAEAVRPMIGSEGEGNVFVGASVPFGMIKPGPDCNYSSNSGHTPLNKDKNFHGISHTHLSGTGGGPKYGNVLITPSTNGDINDTNKIIRESEFARAGYYTTRLKKSNIKVEVTSTHSVAFHNYTFPNSDSTWIRLDLGHYLGRTVEENENNGEQQQFVGSELEIVSPTQVRGYTRVKGGWNRGMAYTVYFYAEFNTPIIESRLYRNNTKLENTSSISDNNSSAKAFFKMRPNSKTVSCKVAISFISTGKAQENLTKEQPTWDFQAVRDQSKAKWNELLGAITIQEKDTNKINVFYTALYHTCLMPANRTGENPLWKSNQPYYDDFYAIWDTYRTSFPLLTLLDEKRVSDIINSLTDTYRHTGYLPDARSGNDNGLTQGGSNTDVVIADAYVKNIKGIDYEYALEAMLKNAESDPGSFHRKVGRGGILDYKRLGYVPYSHERSATRTVEYSLCDFAIGQVAKGLNKGELANESYRRSNFWKNLWRDTTVGSVRGFIWPKDESGEWIDSTMQVKFSNKTWKFEKNKDLFTPSSFGWGWEDVFYEGNSHHYSLHIPHDVKGLIEKSGGAKQFEARLDTFFSKGHYDVSNEPCFFTPVLYHYIGKPGRSNEVIKSIIKNKYKNTADGIPGNDDSGSMSSWYAFHAIGLYPNAGQNIYLITNPLHDKVTIKNADGKPFKVLVKRRNNRCIYINKAMINGKPYSKIWLTHDDIKQGGELLLEMVEKPTKWGSDMNSLPPNGL